MVRRYLAAGIIIVVVGLALVAAAGAQEFAETIVKRGVVEGDLYLAGRTVEVAAEVRGDLVAAGQRINVGERIDEDVIAVGEIVTLTGNVADDVRAAGRVVTVMGSVGDHVVAAGETVTLSTGATTGGRAWLAGRIVQVLGDVGGELRAAGQEVVIGGAVLGDVSITAQRIRVLDTAHVHGSFEYRSATAPEIAEGAVIDGDITRQAMPEVSRGAEDGVGAMLGAGALFVVSMFIVGLVYLLAFPVVAAEAAQAGSDHPWASLGLGLAALFAVPFLSLILTATVVGLMLALVILATWTVALVTGYVNGVALTVGLVTRRWFGAAPRRGASLLAFFVGLGVLSVLQLVPLVGQLAALLVWSVGVGSLVMALARRYRASSRPAAA